MEGCPDMFDIQQTPRGTDARVEAEEEEGKDRERKKEREMMSKPW